ncbi:hypothetical protein [Arthrobacter sp. NA-172]|uniref:hypothetical protein n=1 Tax=Arthrobacter sp. NA-172 TaxID=3367524 RepID=UPI00375452D7
MSTNFEADESGIALLLEELAAVTSYARELLGQVKLRVSHDHRRVGRGRGPGF